MERLLENSKSDWDAYRVSRNFSVNPLVLIARSKKLTLQDCLHTWEKQCQNNCAETRALEEQNNRLIIDALELSDFFDSTVPMHQITLSANPLFRYRGPKANYRERFLQDTIAELLSYAVGCFMGRYSLDQPGLVYAGAKSPSFNPSLFATIPADDDGILPVTAGPYFEDDIVYLLTLFLSKVWGKNFLEQSILTVAKHLPGPSMVSGREKIRLYMQRHFFQFHRKAYESRPLYWLFTSGRARAFQCVVYMHRYNVYTLVRMRTRYVTPLRGILTSQLHQLEKDLAAPISPAHLKKLQKQQRVLLAQERELRSFDAVLQDFANRKIALNLDSGVKTNDQPFAPLVSKM